MPMKKFRALILVDRHHFGGSVAERLVETVRHYDVCFESLKLA